RSKPDWSLDVCSSDLEGMTVFLTTHYMEEAEGSDRVVIIDGGKIAAEGTPVQLKNQFSHSSLYLYGEADALAASLRAAGIPCERDRKSVVQEWRARRG